MLRQVNLLSPEILVSGRFSEDGRTLQALLNALSAICEEKYNCALEGITPEALVELLEPLCGGGGELTKDSRALSRGKSAKERTESHNMQSGNLPAVERV